RAFLAILEMRASEAIAWGERAVALAAEDTPAREFATSMLAFGLDQAGRHAEARATGVSDYTLGRVLLAAAELGPPRALLEAEVRRMEAQRSLVGAALSLSLLARAEFVAGEWASADVHAARAVALAVEADDTAAQVYAYAAAVLVPAA